MHLTPRERDRLLVYVAAELARDRRKDGVDLNHPEAVALISDEMIEAARRGSSYNEVLKAGYGALSEQDVMTHVPDMVDHLEVEVMFTEGTKLVPIEYPISENPES